MHGPTRVAHTHAQAHTHTHTHTHFKDTPPPAGRSESLRGQCVCVCAWVCVRACVLACVRACVLARACSAQPPSVHQTIQPWGGCVAQVSALYLGLLVDASVRVEPNRTGRP